ncbi:MAG: SBBP repeat-containing protein [Chthoniobacterales bacterium]
MTKINAQGTALVYSTYLGGGSSEYGNGIAVDSEGKVCLTGSTSSTDFPTVNPIQANSGGLGDAFVTKLNAAGSALVYSTFPGGSKEETGFGIAVDPSGNACVTGRTVSTDFPTANAFQSTFGGGTQDAFVTKINAAGSAFVYSTYLGSSGGFSETEFGRAIAADSNGNAYVTGTTGSNFFPTANAIQDTLGGNTDVFVTKINSAGSALVYSTFLGGQSYEDGLGIAVDPNGNVYLTGETVGTSDSMGDFPTANPIQAELSGIRDAFVTKINSAGSALIYSTYLGGKNSETGHEIAADALGNAYITGETWSADFPTANAIQNKKEGLASDAFITKLNPAGSEFVYSTYLGGASAEIAYGIAVDSAKNVYVAGYTSSGDFPTKNPIQQDYAEGFQDAFVAKISDSQPPAPNKYDFNRDGNADFIIYKPTARRAVAWFLDGTQFDSADFIDPLIPAGFQIVDAADFNNNGKPDLLLFNASTRESRIWFLNGTTRTGTASGPMITSGFALIGAADFDRDGDPDYLLYNAATGRTALRFLNGTTLVRGALGPLVPEGYLPVATGDFNRDGFPDLALFNSANGKTRIFYLNGANKIGAKDGPTIPEGFVLKGVATFPGNLKPDLVLLNPSTRRTAIWLLNGVTVGEKVAGPRLPEGFTLAAP